MTSTGAQPVTLGRSRGELPVARVALIRAPIVVFPRSLSSYGPVPPIGLAYIAAVLREAGHDVQVVDGSGAAIDQFVDFETPVGTLRRIGLSPDEIIDRVRPGTDVIGVTHMFLHEWPLVREIVECARRRHPDATIVLGGENATAFRDWIFRETDAVDVCVLGEGEATTVELVSRIAEGRPLAGLEGIAVRVPSPDVDETLSPRLRKLGDIPRPAWDLFPMENYWRYADFFGVNRGRSIPVLATRGCPYKCSFCSSPQMWTTRYVVRDPEDVVDEIADYVERFDIECVNFCDLTAITKRSWALQFCDALERRNLGIDWQVPVGTRAEVLDREVLQRLYDTGCRYVTYAPESGSERMLEVYDKRVKLPSILESLHHAHQVGLHTRINIIIGHPEERWSDVRQSVRFLLKAARVGCDDAAIIMFCPYPGSADFTALVESGRHTMDEAAYYVGISRTSAKHRSYNPTMSSPQLRALQLAMVLLFYGAGLLLHPRRLGEYIRAQTSGTENTFFDQLVRIKWRGFRPDRHREQPAEPPLAA